MLIIVRAVSSWVTRGTEVDDGGNTLLVAVRKSITDSNTVMEYPTFSPDSTGRTNTRTFRNERIRVGHRRFRTKKVGRRGGRPPPAGQRRPANSAVL